MENTQLFFNNCLDGNEFEHWLVNLLQGYGFKAWRTQKGGEGDGGIDLIAETTEHDQLWRFAIQCKFQNAAIGKRPVQEVYTGVRYHNLQAYPVVITNNRAKIAVRTYAENLGVEIISCSQWGELRSLVKTKLFTNLNVKGLMAILTRRILSASNALDKDIPTEAYTTLSEKIKDMEQDFEKERLYVHATCKVTNVCKIQPIFSGTVVRDIRHTESLVNVGNEIFEHLRKQSGFSHFRFAQHEEGLYSVWLTNMTNTGGGGSVAGLFNRQGSCMGLSVCRLIMPGDDTYNIGTQSRKVFSSDNVDACKSFISWLNCRLTRFMVVIAAKQTGILSNFGFRFVPAPPSGRFDHIYTDQELYKAFNLPQNYIDIIEAVIKERK